MTATKEGLMKKKSPLVVAGVLLLVLILAGSALAMSSANYALEWYVMMSGGGGGEAESTNYSMDFTVGQVATGNSASANYAAGLGYWAGLPSVITFLPLINRNN
jgi:multisubunit Na+/H+ antiporter MnhB subunit